MVEYAIDKEFYNIFDGLNIQQDKLTTFLTSFHQLLENQNEKFNHQLEKEKAILKADLKEELLKELASKADIIEVKKEIENNGGVAAVIGFDVSDESAFVEGIKTIIDSDGELSYLVNNAGITNDKLAMRMSVEDFKKVIDANLTSTFIGCREALKVMSKKRFGSVVNVASIVAEMGNLGQANYVASKGGVVAMTKTFAL